jgi:hypothetical protein
MWRVAQYQLLILNTTGTGIDLGELIQEVRERIPGLPVLHIGPSAPLGIPADVPTISEDFTPDHLLTTVGSLIQQRA